MKFEDLMAVGITFVVIAVTLGVGVKINDNVGDEFAANSSAEAALQNGTEGMLELASWLPLIGLVIAATVIIGLIVTKFARPGR